MLPRLFLAAAIALLVYATYKLVTVARADCLPRQAIVATISCPDWTAQPGVNGDRVWWATRATVELNTGAIRFSGPVRMTCPELWYVIEWTCAPEYGAAADNGFAGGQVYYLVPHLGDGD